MSIFSVGVSGLNVAQMGILTTSHNIANASTPGYSRQIIVQETNVPMFSGVGFIGQGANVQTVQRIYNDFIGRQLLSAQTVAAEMQSYASQIEQIDNLLADPDAGLSPALAEFFKGVQDVAANPSSIPSRQSMLSSAEALVARFKALEQRLQEVRDGVNTQITSHVTAINNYSAQLAKINQQIVLARAGSMSQEPNDLLDQRNQIIKDLNQLIRVTTVEQSDGQLNAFFGNGQPLVIGNLSYSLTSLMSADDPERIDVGLVGVGGTKLSIPESQITGGTLGGLVSFRSETLDEAQNALGRIAITLAQNFNDQQKLGMDLAGVLGQNLFNIPDPVVKPDSSNSVGSGTPTVSFDAATIGSLTSSDYQLSFDGTNHILQRLSDGQTWSDPSLAGLPWPIDGITVTTGSWVPIAGDSVLIQPTRTGARNIEVAFSDARMIAAAAPIRTKTSLANTGTASIDAGSVVSVANLPLTGAVTLTYDALNAEFDITGPLPSLPLSIPYVSGQAMTFDGISVTINGNPANNDSFTIEKNAEGVSDNRNAVLLGALQTKSTMIGGTANYQSAYSQIVSRIGSKTNEVITIGNAQQTLADRATEAMQTVSGVNLDEEAANLLRYQQAYQAAAKVLATASTIFDEILALGN